jgi:hypothetical protein
MAERAGDVDCRQWLADLFGVHTVGAPDPLGLSLPGRQVAFEGALSDVAPQMILTDFTVDRVFPVQPLEGAEPVAAMRTGGPEGARCIGVRKAHPGGGQAVYLGFRPRDDQAASTGVETRAWFDILSALGAYPGDDNPAALSRGGGLLACAFPNGAVAVCPHFMDYPENWPGGFFRDEEDDRRIVAANPLSDDRLALRRLRVAGQKVSYDGRHSVAWRCDAGGRLIAFAGLGCTGIKLNGRSYRWSDQPVDIGWHPLSAEQRTERYAPLCRVWVGSPGQVRLPLDLPAGDVEVWLGAHMPWGGRPRRAAHGRAGFGERQVTFGVSKGSLSLDVDEDIAGHWLYVARPAA